MSKDNFQKKHSPIVDIDPNTLGYDASNVIAKPFVSTNKKRLSELVDKVASLSDEETKKCLGQALTSFSGRHRNYKDIISRNYETVAKAVTVPETFSGHKKLVLGAYCTHEYSIEAAALFNPSIVPHPDQSDVNEGDLRFIMSLRATGEGHISSIVFRTGIIDQSGKTTFDENNHLFETPKLSQSNSKNSPQEKNYDITFSTESNISERVIFPISNDESGGLEDARFVQFTDDDGKVTYYATYTAYSQPDIQPKLIETEDFLTFKVRTLSGDAVKDKGFALFPRKINGKYAMLSRQDGEHNHIMFSDNLHKWDKAERLESPNPYWAFMQEGNCGSPIETSEGWLVITHGVGMMREYSIGAILLDLKDPTKVIGALEDPLLVPEEREREGYVPNVVYSCGALIHNENLVLPYAASDQFCLIAKAGIPELLKLLEPSPKTGVKLAFKKDAQFKR